MPFIEQKLTLRNLFLNPGKSLVYSWRKLLPLNKFKRLPPSMLAVTTSTEKAARLPSNPDYNSPFMEKERKNFFFSGLLTMVLT